MIALAQPQDGRFYARGRRVCRRPKDCGNGVIYFGYAVCDLAEGVNDEAAEEVAIALNDAIDRGLVL